MSTPNADASVPEISGASDFPATTEEKPVVFTAAAIRKVEEYCNTLEEARGKYLRIFVQGGGCSGFEYGFSFDEQKEQDQLIAQDEIHVLIDAFSIPYLEGSVVDFTESLMGSGFSVTNPNATGTCGCGHSFSA